MELCCLGCGKEGKFLKKNGKFYCAESPNSCEFKKKKDSDKKKGKPFTKNNYVRKGVVPWNKGLKNPYSPETIKKISDTFLFHRVVKIKYNYLEALIVVQYTIGYFIC